MTDGDCSFMIDTASVFFNYFRVTGWFHSASDTLAEVALGGGAPRGGSSLTGQPHPGVAEALGPDKGFFIEALLDEGTAAADLSLRFVTKNGRRIEARIDTLCKERTAGFVGRRIVHDFLDRVQQIPNARVLDIGGRSRSGVDRSQLFKSAECVVLDVLAGDNVDVVGDAHAMSRLLPHGSFDAIFSVSVFEHLLMPWVVAAEMSRVLKPGGLAFISSHQTIGIHDQPWDFWRFSDNAWDALFNRLTGFEILGKAMEDPQFIVPHFNAGERGANLEGAVGFIGSCMMARKISEPAVPWNPMLVSDIVETTYPSG